ncbi:MAG TPA: hypothetical protein VF133_10775 [Terriglobales bacterium]
MNLLDLMSVEYRRSRRALYSSVALGAFLYLIALGDVVSKHQFSESLAILAFVLQSTGLVLRYRSTRRYESAEEIRRIAFLEDALGIAPSELRKTEIASRVGGARAPERIFVGKYFASEAPQGVLRFLDDLSESAFWTCEVARSAGRALLVLVLVGAMFSIFALLGLLNAGVAATNVKIGAEAFVVTLAFVVAGEMLLLSLDYFALAGKASRILTSASSLLESKGVDRDATIILFGEYNCALSATAPLPAFLYKLLQARLNAAWSARKAELPVQ